MRIQLAKTRRRKPGAGPDRRGTYGITDRRPEAATQVRLLGVVRESPQSSESARLQSLANGRHEREANRIADRVMRQPGPATSRRAAPATGRSRSLDAATRGFFEPRFGFDFGDVRVSTNSAANESARTLGAHAYTRGNEIAFGRGEYQPGTRAGRRLLAHELAHVVQQSPAEGRAQPQSIAASMSRAPVGQTQPKLIATGDAAGFVALANSIIGNIYVEVSVSSSGEVTLGPSPNAGPPEREGQYLINSLKTIIDDAKTTTVDFIHGRTSTRAGDQNVIIGSYGLQRLDLDDIGALGSGKGGTTSGTALAHELIEQYRKQVHGELYGPAHKAGEKIEEDMSGAKRMAHSVKRINATTIEVTVPWKYPDGTVIDVTMTLTNNNVTNVVRKKRP